MPADVLLCTDISLAASWYNGTRGYSNANSARPPPDAHLLNRARFDSHSTDNSFIRVKGGRLGTGKDPCQLLYHSLKGGSCLKNDPKNWLKS